MDQGPCCHRFTSQRRHDGRCVEKNEVVSHPRGHEVKGPLRSEAPVPFTVDSQPLDREEKSLPPVITGCSFEISGLPSFLGVEGAALAEAPCCSLQVVNVIGISVGTGLASACDTLMSQVRTDHPSPARLIRSVTFPVGRDIGDCPLYGFCCLLFVKYCAAGDCGCKESRLS